MNGSVSLVVSVCWQCGVTEKVQSVADISVVISCCVQVVVFPGHSDLTVVCLCRRWQSGELRFSLFSSRSVIDLILWWPQQGLLVFVLLATSLSVWQLVIVY